MYNILAISGDPGGANALVPVIKLLRNNNSMNVILYAYNEGYNIWSHKFSDANKIPLSVGKKFIAEKLIDLKIDLLLTATSCNKYLFESQFIIEANKLGISTISLLDFWGSYRFRFYNYSEDEKSLPEKIAIMDESCFNEMVSEGFDKEKLCITGQPVFGNLNMLASEFTEEKKELLLNYYNIKKESLIVSFISQPFSELYGDENIIYPYYGFTEFDALKEIINSLNNLSQQLNANIKLVICAHPRENIGKFKPFLSETVVVFEQGMIMEDSVVLNSKDVVLSSDLIIGMNSILLVESCYMKKIAISFQPGLLIDDVLPTNKMGYTIPVYENKMLYDVISDYIFDHEKKEKQISKLDRLILPNSPAKNVFKLVIHQLKNRGGK